MQGEKKKIRRWTTNHRQAAERLADALGFSIERVSTKMVRVVVAANEMSGKRKPIRALGYMTYIALDIQRRPIEEVLDACRWKGTIPHNSKCSSHEQAALARLIKARGSR